MRFQVCRLTGTESDPVGLLISETGADANDRIIVVNAGTPVLEIGDIDGQQEIVPSGNTVYLPQNGVASFIYSGSAWHLESIHTDRVTFSSIAIDTLTTDELGDDTSPHDLTQTEMKSHYHSTLGDASGTTVVYNCPEADEGWNVCFHVGIAGQGISINPNGTEQYWLNGTQLTAGQNIQIPDVAADIGESLWCYSITDSGVTTQVHCDSKYTDWEGE